MLPDSLLWTAFSARCYLLVRTPKKSHATPGGCQPLEEIGLNLQLGEQ